MLRSQSDFSARNHSIDQAFRPFEPTKRVNRPFYVPERVNSMDRVFSEYDWNNHKFTTTLRPAPQHRRTSVLPQRNLPSDSTLVPNDEYSRTTCEDRGSDLYTPFMPKHISRGIPDETLVSSYLLSSASSPPSLTSNEWEHQSNHYPSSPIARHDTSHSPLQQSIIANSELDREYQLPPSSSRVVKQRKDLQAENASRTNRPQSDSRPTTVDQDSSSILCGQKTTATTGSTHSCTWSSDVTAVGISESKGKLSSFGACSRKKDSSRVTPDCQRLWPMRTDEEIWRKGSTSRRSFTRSSSAVSRLHHIDQEEEEEEDDEAEAEEHQETRITNILSAIHYKYVAVGLRIQLAVHRTEKKVTHKLSDKRKRRNPNVL